MNATPIPALLAAARRAAQHGDAAASADALRAVLALQPDHVEALNGLAQQAIARGDHAAAVTLLQRARTHAPDQVEIAKNLGVALLAAGDLPGAQAQLEHAATLAPQLPLIPLILGEVLEARGLPLQATAAYFRAVLTAQQAGRWLDEATTPAPLRARVQHAMAYAERGRGDVFAALLDPLRSAYGAAAVQRVARALAGYLGDPSVQPSDPRQRPRFLFIPDVAAQPFHANDRFDWMPAVVDAWPAIRDEALAMLAGNDGVEPFLRFDDPSQAHAYLGSRSGTAAWDARFFHRDGVAHGDNLARCPHTAALLDRLPLVRIAGHAPEICFSVLRPDTHILPHYGVTNARLVVHLPLVIPDDCVLTVGGETHAWRAGEPVVFDDTFLHEAWNRSTQPRVILLMDAWHPDLTDVEREAIRTLVEGMGRFHRG